MSTYPLLQVHRKYRAGRHEFITVGADHNLDDSVMDQVQNSNTSTVTIENAKVGIGTTNLAKALNVYGDAVITQSVGIGTINPYKSLDVRGDMIVATNIGVGTTTPAYPLHIEGNVYANGTVYASNMQILGEFVTLNTITSNTEQMTIINAGTGPALRVVQEGNQPIAEFYDHESGPSLFLDNDGKIGIGTTNVPVTLTISATDGVLLPRGDNNARPTGIRGLVRYNTTTDQFEGFGAGDTWGSLGGVKSTDQTTYISAEAFPGANDSNLRFYTGGIEKMAVTSNGYVGIGTYAPIAHLHVYNDEIEFPPPNALASITSNVFTIEQFPYGNGTYITTSSSEASAAYTSYHAFSKTLGWENEIWKSTFPITFPQYLQIEVPNPIHVTKYSITNGTNFDGDGLTLAPKTWFLQASFDGITFSTIGSYENVVWNSQGEVKTYTVPTNYKKYRFYRLLITEGYSLTEVHIGEWRLFGFEKSPYAIFEDTFVGIGTTIPLANLDVYGSVRFDNILTSNITITGSSFVQNDSQFKRSRLQLAPYIYYLQVPVNNYSTFQTAVDGIWAIYPWKTQIYHNGYKMAWISNSNADYTVSYQHIGETTQIVVNLEEDAQYGDVLDITFWPSYIGESATMEPGYMLQNIQYTQWSRDVSNSNLYYTSANVGLGTNVPTRTLDVAGEGLFRSNLMVGPIDCNAPRALLHVQGDAYMEHLILQPTMVNYNPTPFPEYPPACNMVYMTFKPGKSIDDYARFIQEGDQDDYRFILELHNTAEEKFIVRAANSTANPQDNSDILTVSGIGKAVGVGTTVPLRTLDVFGDATISSNLGIGVRHPTKALDVIGEMIISSNVGIGLTEPRTALDVIGSAMIASNLMIGNGLSLSIPLYTLHVDGDLYATSNVTFGSNLSISGSIDALGTLAISGSMFISGGSNEISGDVYMRSNLYVSSNIGIGTDAPILPLEIHSTSAILLPTGSDAERPGAPQIGYVRFNTDTQQFEGFGAGNTWGSLGGVKSTDQLTYITAELNAGANDSNLRMFTGGLQRMIITSNGNVGIGTTQPKQLFHVEGDALISNTLYTCNLNVIGQTFMNNDTTVFRARLQIKPLRIYTAPISTSNTFVSYYDGLYAFYPENADVYINGVRMAWLASNTRDFDVTYENLPDLTTKVTLTLEDEIYSGDILDATLWPSYLSDTVTTQPGFLIQQISYIDTRSASGGILIEAPIVQPLQTASYQYVHEVNVPSQSNFTYSINGRFEFTTNRTDVFLNGIRLINSSNVVDYTVTSSYLVSTTEVTLNLTNPVTEGDIVNVTLWPGSVVTSFGSNFNGVIYQDFTYFQRVGSSNTCNITFQYGNLGIGTTSPRNPLHVEGNITFDGVMYDRSNQAIWIPGTAVEWKNATFPNPQLTAPGGGLFLHTSRKGQFRYIGDEISYQFTITGYVYAKPSSITTDYVLSLEYPLHLPTYVNGSIIGDCWMSVSYGSPATTTTYKAYAMVSTGFNNAVIIRYLNGTYDASLAEINVNNTITLNGTLTYRTTYLSTELSLPKTYIPNSFTQNEYGYTGLNVNGVPARGRLDIVENGGCNLPALVIDQRGEASNILEVRSNVSQMQFVIDRDGNIGIGTAIPTTKLDVIGDTKITGTLFTSNLVTYGSNTTLNTYTIATSNVSISNIIGTGPALTVSQKGIGAGYPIADFYDVDVSTTTPVFRIADGGNVGIGTTTPTAKLDVNGSLKTSTIMVGNRPLMTWWVFWVQKAFNLGANVFYEMNIPSRPGNEADNMRLYRMPLNIVISGCVIITDADTESGTFTVQVYTGTVYETLIINQQSESCTNESSVRMHFNTPYAVAENTNISVKVSQTATGREFSIQLFGYQY